MALKISLVLETCLSYQPLPKAVSPSGEEQCQLCGHCDGVMVM